MAYTSAAKARLLPKGRATRQACASRRSAGIVRASSAVDPTTAVSGGVAAAAVAGAIYWYTDPSRRRQAGVEAAGGNEKDAVQQYFENEGFERWSKIYGETEDVSRVQADIREGHRATVEKALNWLGDELSGKAICDVGCGTGSLAIPLAHRGAQVSASDISREMAEATREAAGSKGVQSRVSVEAMDLEQVQGSFDVVCALDVIIHYPPEKAAEMIANLAPLAKSTLVISFAPATPRYVLLKRIGELFPGPSKATRAYLHDEKDVERALNANGFRVTHRDLTATSFYFSRLLCAERT